MAVFTDLPLEVVGEILKNLDTLKSLKQSILSCQHFYSAFKETHGVGAAIICNRIPRGLLPYAVAILEAGRPTGSREDVLLDLHDEPDILRSRLISLPNQELGTLSRMYTIIGKRALELAVTALDRLLTCVMEPGFLRMSFTSTENIRICRGFYRVELWYALFSYGPHATDNPEELVTDQDLFFMKYPPWEVEQFHCIRVYLTQKLIEVTADVVAHDVEFGFKRMSYLEFLRIEFGALNTVAEEETEWQEQCLSKGIMFLDQLISAASYDDQRQLLSTMWSHGARPYLGSAVREAGLNAQGQGILPEDMSESDVESLFCPSHWDEGRDEGPYQAWKQAPAFYSPGRLSTRGFSDDLWDVAYVFWDLDRTQHLISSGVFGSLEVMETRRQCRPTYGEMEESWRERREIWERGGSGYWSPGNTSRVVWGLPRVPRSST